jgi:hypothetical protein
MRPMYLPCDCLDVLKFISIVKGWAPLAILPILRGGRQSFYPSEVWFCLPDCLRRIIVLTTPTELVLMISFSHPGPCILGLIIPTTRFNYSSFLFNRRTDLHRPQNSDCCTLCHLNFVCLAELSCFLIARLGFPRTNPTHCCSRVLRCCIVVLVLRQCCCCNEAMAAAQPGGLYQKALGAAWRGCCCQTVPPKWVYQTSLSHHEVPTPGVLGRGTSAQTEGLKEVRISVVRVWARSKFLLKFSKMSDSEEVHL